MKWNTENQAVMLKKGTVIVVGVVIHGHIENTQYILEEDWCAFLASGTTKVIDTGNIESIDPI